MGLDKEKERLRKQRYRETHREQLREYNRSRRVNRRANQRKSLYGISEEQYQDLLSQSGNTCTICGKSPGVKRALHIDHNHTTGKVRGLLCAGCNRSIAALDNEEWLTKAKDYIEKNS